MAIQHDVRLLCRALGPRILDDSDDFRAALDDFLGDRMASQGQINLLVDTVRLGAFEQLERLMDGGAPGPAAVATAGDGLADNRGSADVDSCRWACAVLAFATGRITEAEMSGYSLGMRPGASETPTAPPPAAETASRPVPGHAPAYAAPPAYTSPPGYGAAGESPPSRRTPVIAAAVSIALLILAVTGGWWWLDGRDSGSEAATQSPTDPPAVECEDLAVDNGEAEMSEHTTTPDSAGEAMTHGTLCADQVASHFQPLGTALEPLVDNCHMEQKGAGQEVKVLCFQHDSDNMQLTMVQLSDQETLEKYRNRIFTRHEVMQNSTPAGVYADWQGPANAFIYWDVPDHFMAGTLSGPLADKATLDETYQSIGSPVSAH